MVPRGGGGRQQPSAGHGLSDYPPNPRSSPRRGGGHCGPSSSMARVAFTWISGLGPSCSPHPCLRRPHLCLRWRGSRAASEASAGFHLSVFFCGERNIRKTFALTLSAPPHGAVIAGPSGKKYRANLGPTSPDNFVKPSAATPGCLAQVGRRVRPEQGELPEPETNGSPAALLGVLQGQGQGQGLGLAGEEAVADRSGFRRSWSVASG